MTDGLTFWWSVATTDYYFGYEANCRKVTWADVSDLSGRYLDRLELRDRGQDARRRLRRRSARERAREGPRLREDRADNAFWWQQR